MKFNVKVVKTKQQQKIDTIYWRSFISYFKFITVPPNNTACFQQTKTS